MMLAAELTVLDRTSRRRSVDIATTVRSDGVPFDVAIEDLSAGGFRATLPRALAVGDEVTVGLPGAGRADAVVVWVDRSLHGFSFLHAVDANWLANAHPVDTVVPMSVATPTPTETVFVETWTDMRSILWLSGIAGAVGLLLVMLFR